jgi:hypothetical protein
MGLTEEVGRKWIGCTWLSMRFGSSSMGARDYLAELVLKGDSGTQGGLRYSRGTLVSQGGLCSLEKFS